MSVNWEVTGSTAVTIEPLRAVARAQLTMVSRPSTSEFATIHAAALFSDGVVIDSTFRVEVMGKIVPQLSIVGSSTLVQGDNEFSLEFDPASYDSELLSVNWELTGASTAAISSSSDSGCVIAVSGVPLVAEQPVLTVTAHFEGNVTRTATRTLSISGKTYPENVVLTGVDTISSIGSESYGISFSPDGYDAQLVSVEYSLSGASTAIISSYDNTGCTISVSELPLTAENVVLTAVATFEGNVQRTGSKAITISGKTYPGSMSLSGPAMITQIGAQQYSTAFTPAVYDATLLRVDYILVGATTAEISQPGSTGCMVNVPTLPLDTENVTLQATAYFEGNVTRQATLAITISGKTYPDTATITGDASIAQPGTKQYAIGFTPASYDAVLQSVAWSLPVGSAASIVSQSNAGCTIEVEELPLSAEQTVLTAVATFEGNVQLTASKQLSISGKTFPSDASITGTANIQSAGAFNYGLAFIPAAYDAELQEVVWTLNGASTGRITAQSESGCTVSFSSLPYSSEIATLTMHAVFEGSRTIIKDFTLNITAMVFPELSISGDDTISSEGDTVYTPVFTPSVYDAQLLSVSWALNSGAPASIATGANNTGVLTVAALPESDTQVTITCTAEFENNVTRTATKTVTIIPPSQELVDLDLPSGTLWAKGNIVPNGSGGYKVGVETDYGAYVSWGNVTPHFSSDGSTFDDSYDFGSSNTGPYAQTPGASIQFVTQDKQADFAPDSGNDAARELLGGSWRMPTATEFKELYDNTDNEWATVNGVNGRKFMKKTDHSVYVFFPAAGYGNNTTLEGRESNGDYWTSSIYSIGRAFNLFLNRTSVSSQSDNNRYSGFSVRAVQSSS